MGNEFTAPPDLFARWRADDVEARAAEDAVLRASLMALEGRGQPPSLEERDGATKLRRRADAMLQEAFAEMKKQSG